MRCCHHSLVRKIVPAAWLIHSAIYQFDVPNRDARKALTKTEAVLEALVEVLKLEELELRISSNNNKGYKDASSRDCEGIIKCSAWHETSEGDLKYMY